MTPCPTRNPDPPERTACCEQCGQRDYLNSDGLCESCSEYQADIERGRLFDRAMRAALKPQADLTIYYPRGYGLSQCEIAPPWPLVRATTIWSRWMPVLHPDAETQWSLEIIYP